MGSPAEFLETSEDKYPQGDAARIERIRQLQKASEAAFLEGSNDGAQEASAILDDAVRPVDEFAAPTEE